jgi:prefoldin alpha subunit
LSSKNEEALRRLAVELQILEGTADALQQRINLVSAALTELSVANATLEGLEEEKHGSSLFVPIGGGSYVKANLETADKVVVGIGAGVAVERTVKEAKENVENRVAELDKTRSSLLNQLRQAVSKIQEGRSKFQELTTKAGERERSKPV